MFYSHDNVKSYIIHNKSGQIEDITIHEEFNMQHS